MNKFWNFGEPDGPNELRLDGEIASETWWGDEVTPAMFRAELMEHPGDITVWINSPGGDVFAASSIYTALKEHKGRVTVKIEALAASAASIVAMAGDEVLMSPTAYMMIHRAATFAIGNVDDMKEAARTLDEIDAGIADVYAAKTGQSADKILRMMQTTTWIKAASAVELGFADGILYQGEAQDEPATPEPQEGETATASDALEAARQALSQRRAAAMGSACVFAASASADALITRLLNRPESAEPPEPDDDDEARERFALRMKLMRNNIMGGME